METLEKNKLSPVFAFAFLLLLSIPLTTYSIAHPQETRSHAAATTSLSFQPDATSDSPLQKNVGDPIDLDMYIDPGSNVVTFVKYRVNFDPAKVKPASATPFDINQDAFSNVEGPVVTTNSVAQSLAISTDPVKAVRTKTKIGTIHFIAIGNTGGTPTTIAFSKQSQALSSGVSDGSVQNVLNSAPPANIVITGASTDATPSKTAVSVTLLLHGIGKGGDNVNPAANSLSNKSPLHQQRNLNMQIINANDEMVSETNTLVSYVSGSGTFAGTVNLPTVPATIPTGAYTIKLKSDRYLRRTIPGIQQLVANQTTTLPPLELIAGDTNNDNSLNVLDYNALLDCGYGELKPKTNGDQNSLFKSSTCQIHAPADNVDIDDNGVVNSADYNLFLRELTVQDGD